MDLKQQMLNTYLSPKGEQYKHIDFKKVEIENQIKYMPLSFDRMTL